MRTLVHRRVALGNNHRYSLLSVDVICIDPDFIRFLKCDSDMLACRNNFGLQPSSS
jgi:hypothetical protein